MRRITFSFTAQIAVIKWLLQNLRHNLRMKNADHAYIWQSRDWPNWHYDLAALVAPLADVRHAQGLLFGRLADVGMALRDQASLAVLTQDVTKTSEIEGEHLNVESVRSSIMNKSTCWALLAQH